MLLKAKEDGIAAIPSMNTLISNKLLLYYLLRRSFTQFNKRFASELASSSSIAFSR